MSTALSITPEGTKNSLNVQGFHEAVKILEGLSTRDQKQTILKVMRKAARPIPRDARANLGGYSDRVSRSIRVWQPRGATKNDNPRLFVGVKSNFRGYGDPNDPWFAHMIEQGSSGVKGERSSRGGPRDGDDSFFKIRASRTNVGGRFRKDTPPRPFFGPAVESNQERAARVMITDMSAELLKIVERNKK